MQKSSTAVPSHTSQITFKNEDDVYSVDDPSRQPSQTSPKPSKGRSASKSSLKGKGSVKDTGASRGSMKNKPSGPVTSTPKSSKHKGPKNLDISGITGSRQTFEVESGDYIPMPYIFRTPNLESSKEVKNIPTKCPPYYLQLDHALAVVWILYSRKEIKQPLGIVQLQWALNFLQGIYNRRGEHPKDVGLCIQQIQDNLIEQYAQLVDDVEYAKKPTSDTKEKTKGKDKSKKSKSKSAKGSRSESEVADVEHEEVEINGTGGEGGAETEGGDETENGEAGAEQGEKACEDHTCGNKLCTEEKEDVILKQVPFSINYAEMMSRSPPNLEELYPCCKSSKTSSIVSTTRKSVSGVGQSVSRDNMLEFLKAWRREQVEKIEAELKRLKSIENFIGSAEVDNFTPYLDDKMLASLGTEKPNSSKSKSKEKKSS